MKKNHIKYSIVFLLFTSFIFVVGCEDPIQSSSDLRFPEDEEVSFSKHVKPFMQYTCATAGCHDGYTIAGGRIMTEYYTYFNTANIGLIIRGNPDASLLNQIAEGQNKHLYQVNRNLPTKNQQDGLRRWVENEAPNN